MSPPPARPAFSGPATQVFEALVVRHGPVAPRLGAAPPPLPGPRQPPPGEPLLVLARALARRSGPPPLDRPRAEGPAPAARLLRRIARRARIWRRGSTVSLPSPAALAAALAAEADPDGRLDLVAAAPLAVARQVTGAARAPAEVGR